MIQTPVPPTFSLRAAQTTEPAIKPAPDKAAPEPLPYHMHSAKGGSWMAVNTLQERVAKASSAKGIVPGKANDCAHFSVLPAELLKFIFAQLALNDQQAFASSCKSLHQNRTAWSALLGLGPLMKLLLPPYATALPSQRMVNTLLTLFSTPEELPLPLDDRLQSALTLALLSKIPLRRESNNAALNTVVAAVVSLNEHALLALCDLLDEYARQRCTVTAEGIAHLKSSAEVPAQLLNAISPVLEKAALPLAQRALLALARYCTGFRYSGYGELYPRLTSLFNTRPELASLEIRTLFALTVGGQHHGYLPQAEHWDGPEKIEVARACLKQYAQFARSTHGQLQKLLGLKVGAAVKKHLGEQLSRLAVLPHLNTILGLSAAQAKEFLHDHLCLLEIEVSNLNLYYRIVPLTGYGEKFTHLRACLNDDPTHHGENKAYLETVADRLGHLTRLALEVEPGLVPRLGELLAQWPAKADAEVVLWWFRQRTGMQIKLQNAQGAGLTQPTARET